jgi:hypothetical protein
VSRGTALEWHSSASPALGSLLGFRVVESRNVPPRQIYLVVGCCAVLVFCSGVWVGRSIWRKP